MSDTKSKPTGLALMREPFPEHQISKMCRPTKKDNPLGRCKDCGGYHKIPSIQLSYVGHAALTDRLLECDPWWNWEPVAVDANGFPKLDSEGGMWIRLTVCNVTRLGYGDAQGKTGGDAVKERIGDALRNAAMRFGAALDLWHKGDLHGNDQDDLRTRISKQADKNVKEAEEAEKKAAAGNGGNGNGHGGNGHDKAGAEFVAMCARARNWFKTAKRMDYFTALLAEFNVQVEGDLTAAQRDKFTDRLAEVKKRIQAELAVDKFTQAQAEVIDEPAPAQVEAEFEMMEAKR